MNTEQFVGEIKVVRLLKIISDEVLRTSDMIFKNWKSISEVMGIPCIFNYEEYSNDMWTSWMGRVKLNLFAPSGHLVIMNSVWSKHLKLIIIEALQISSIKHRLERYMFCHLSYQLNEWLCLVDKGNARRMRVRVRKRKRKRESGSRKERDREERVSRKERESKSKIQYDYALDVLCYV